MNIPLHRVRSELGDGRIGVWRYDPSSDSFAIDPSVDLNERRLWSDHRAIRRRPPPKTRRVVLIGESVARGFLLDPGVTPAKRLSAVLRSAGARNGTQFEVIDLARTCLTEPVTLMQQAAALSPDVFVLFFGNNIRPATVLGLYDSSRAAEELRAAHAAALRDRGAAAAQALLDARAAEAVYRPLLTECCELAARLSTPIIFVIPEHNRGDWRESGHLPSPVGTLVKDGASALDDLSHLACLPPVPRRTEAFARCVREVAQDYRAAVVDLSEVIGTHNADRAMFYDYCHMTVAAIDTSARAIADAVAERTGADRPVEIAPPAPSPEVVARAGFLAAIHNAHWGQPAELVAHWLDAALDEWSDIAGDMAAYLDTIDQAVPRWMNSRARSISDPRTQLGRVLFDNRPPANESALAGMIANRLPARGRARARNREGVRAASSARPVIGVFERLARDQQTRFACRQNEFRASSAVTEIPAPQDEGRWELMLSLRAGDIEDCETRCSLALDGQELLQCDLDASWRLVQVVLPPTSQPDRARMVQITWPDGDAPVGDEALEAYRRGDRDCLVRITGKIHRSSVFRKVTAPCEPIEGG